MQGVSRRKVGLRDMEVVFRHVLPGLSLVGLFFVANILMMDLMAERQQGTLRRLLAGPVTVGQFLAAKLIVTVVVCAVAQLLLVLVSAVFFGMRWGHPLAFMAVFISMILAVVGTITLVYGLARTRNQADALSNLVIMGMCLFGGSFFPAELLPPAMRSIGKWTVNHWAISGMRAAIDHEPTRSLVINVAVLLAIGLVTLAVGILALRRQLALERK